MKDAAWDCTTILLYWSHVTQPEHLFNHIVQSITDTSQWLLKEGANLAAQYTEKTLMELLKIVVLNADVKLYQAAQAVIESVGHQMGSIVKLAAILSESGQLSLKTIYETLFDIKQSSTYTRQPHALLAAKSVHSVMHTLSVLLPVRVPLPATTPDIPLQLFLAFHLYRSF